MELKDHNLVEYNDYKEILYEERPCLDRSGNPVEGLHNVWIVLNNEKQFNSYTTNMVKEVILAFRRASNDRACVAVVFTGAGDKAFCTGGNTKEYAEYYAGNPQEYMQYMRLFNDMVTSILTCDRPVVCRVNGMRIGGGQEIGMACDFSIAQDLARFGQAGPIHGSAAIGGSTDFLHLYVGVERAMWSLTLCETWSAQKAFHLGLLTDVVPALKVDGKFVPNPMVITDRFTDEYGRIVYGDYKTGEERNKAKEILKNGEVDLSLLDQRIDKFCTQILYTMPNCITKTLVEARKKKLAHWNANKEASRDWLGLNMMTEAKAGFKAFNEGPKGDREVDFIRLRQMLAQGTPWTDEMIRDISPQYKK
ncbi:MAG: 6-oxocyclohex-1-ene-1-carbonyl-CoA hydratase [Deltaproteobacteria bacterium]|nr:6-oxocyclohex-1-ene-1-carbonyl-CoA hydratase [Deltaproteobacteria bacterium]